MSFSTQNWEQFTALNPSVVKALRQAGFERPTNIQAEVLQQFKHYYDFLIASQTGSGKTLAFALPVLSDILDFLKNATLTQLPQVLLGLIITPTRQLAQQIQQNIRQILEHIDSSVSIVSIIGGMSKQKQLRIIKQRKPHIIIGTPGRIHQFLQDEVFNFQYLKYLILDQADRMIELGHFVEVDQILSKIFRPKLQQFYEKDFKEITQAIAKKDQLNKKQNGLYVKKAGKKVKLNFDLHSIEADKLFEVPMDLFTFVHSDGRVEDNKIQAQNPETENIRNIEHQGNLFREPTEQQLYWLNKLKRRIFFVSATLTRQFKGQKYSIKRKRDEQEEINGKNKNNKKKDKNIRKQKQKEKQKQGKKPEQDNEIENIPKLKALLSRVNFSTKPKIIDQSSELFLPSGLTQKISFTDGEIERISILIAYLKSLSAGAKIIIFGNTIKVSKRIQFFLDSMGYKCSNLHSHMDQKLRLTKLQRFKSSQKINILVSTDVAARGLDFQVTNVIQYGVPLNGDTYVHRAGRTARANRKGEALIIVDRAQGNKWGEINDILNSSVPSRKVEKFVPSKILMDQIQTQVNQLEWIRVNNERQRDARNQKLEEMQADQIGVEPQEQQKRRKYDLDRQEEQMVRHQLKKKVQKIRKQTFRKDPLQKNNIKWKKNKLVLSPDEIMKML